MSAQQSQLKVMDQPMFNKFIKTFSKDTVSRCMELVSVHSCHLGQLTVFTLLTTWPRPELEGRTS